MFSHVMVGANDLEASKKFYDAVLGTLGIGPGVLNNSTRYFYRSRWMVSPLPLPMVERLDFWLKHWNKFTHFMQPASPMVERTVKSHQAPEKGPLVR
jgi:hypothetical protein